MALDPALSPPKLRSSLPAADISGFFEAVVQAWNLQLDAAKWPAPNRPILVHDFPKERLVRPDDSANVITFSVGGAEMAPTSNDGSRIPIRPQVRDRQLNKTKFGYADVTLAWWEDVAVVFNVWSRSNKQGDDTTNYFHRFMMKWAHGYQFFRARGVDRFQFLRRGRDEVDTTEGQELYKRSLVYQIRIEYIDVLEEKLLESVTLNIGIKLQTDTIELP